MKSVRLISLVLILTTLCCVFIGCDQGSAEDIELPARPFYDITVSFQIKDSNGRTIIDAVDYNYKGHEEPITLSTYTMLASQQEGASRPIILTMVGATLARP